MYTDLYTFSKYSLFRVDVSSLIRINQNFPELDEYNNKKAAYVFVFSRPLQITINKSVLFILLSPVWVVQALSLGRKKKPSNSFLPCHFLWRQKLQWHLKAFHKFNRSNVVANTRRRTSNGCQLPASALSVKLFASAPMKKKFQNHRQENDKTPSKIRVFF